MDTTILKIRELSAEADKSELFLKDTMVHNLLKWFLTKVESNERFIGSITYKFNRKRVYQQRHFIYERSILLNNLILDLNRHLTRLIDEKNKIAEDKVIEGISIRTPCEIINKVHLEFANQVISELK